MSVNSKKSKINITIATSFPDMFSGIFTNSLLSKSLKKNIWSCNFLNIKDYGVKNRIDDKLFGGLPGMLIGAPVIENMIEKNRERFQWDKIYYTSPRGTIITQKYLYNILDKIEKKDYRYSILIICGRYEGVDVRAIEYYNMEEFSLGKFILTGGEIPAMALIEGLVRLFPGVLGNSKSIVKESFSEENYIQSPRYTRPRVWKDRVVPEVLLSGHHKNIEKY